MIILSPHSNSQVGTTEGMLSALKLSESASREVKTSGPWVLIRPC